MAYLPLSTANLPDPAIDPAQDKEPRDYFETFLYTGNGGGLQVGDVIKKPADTTTINNSLLFNNDDSAYLSRTPASEGNRKTWTWSGWVKIGKAASTGLFTASTSGADMYTIQLGSDGALNVYAYSGTYPYFRFTSAVFRDYSAWYHFVVAFDSTQTTDTNRIKIYVNGVLQSTTSGSGSGWPTLNYDGGVNNTIKHQFSENVGGASYFDGYLAEVHFTDGTAYDASAFGTFDANGIWIPQTPSVTYGTNGFYLDFSDNTSTTTLGEDQAGSNDWTLNGFVDTSNQVSDSPTDNFATLDPNNKNSVVTLSEGNLSFTASNNRFVTSTTAVNSGKWYLEFSPTAGGGSGVGVGVILATTDVSGGAGFANSGTYTGVGYTTNGNKYISSVGSAYGDGYGAGNVIGVALDLDSSPQTITFYKDDANQGSINLPASNQTWRFATDFSHAGTHSINFGQKTFAETQPTGYLALSENNITVDDQNLESPDFVWIKNRSAADNHHLYDSVRGVQKAIYSNVNTAETDEPNGLLDFNANGFTIGSEVEVNTSGEDYVSWCWKAGTSFSNSAGTNEASIASSGSANTDSGFSIVSYTGDSTGTDGTASTVFHGLSQAPEMIMFKPLDTYDGAVYHSGLTSASYRLVLFSAGATAAQASDNGFFNGTAPTSSVFSIGSRKHTNSNGGMIAYCFHSVEGFSKFGSFIGDGSTSASGPFVYLGFRPAFVILKPAEESRDWRMYDSKRNSYNRAEDPLQVNTTAIESNESGTGGVDFLSNGFKVRTSNPVIYNSSTKKIIYMAFAENPFKYSNAR